MQKGPSFNLFPSTRTPIYSSTGGKAKEFNKPQLSRTYIHYLKGSLGLFCKRLSGEKEKESLFKGLTPSPRVRAPVSQSLARTVPWTMATCWGETHLPEVTYPKEMLGTMYIKVKINKYQCPKRLCELIKTTRL